jgi:hypothetical protein
MSHIDASLESGVPQEQLLVPTITYDQMPLEDRLLVLDSFCNEYSGQVSEFKVGPNHAAFLDAAHNYSALLHLRAALYVESVGNGAVSAGTIAYKIMGEGMHLVNETGLTEVELRLAQLSDDLEHKIEQAGPAIVVDSIQKRIDSLEENIQFMKSEPPEEYAAAIASQMEQQVALRARLAGYFA